MRQITIKLLDRLRALRPGSYQVDVAERTGDSEVIHLHDDFVLVIDKEDPLPTV